MACFWRFFHKTKEKLENISLMSSELQPISILAIRSQTQLRSQRTGRVVLNKIQPVFLGSL